MKWFVLSLLTVLSTACAPRLVSTLPAQSTPNPVRTCKVTITGTRTIRNVYVSINDSLVIAGKTFRSLELDSVPVGKQNVRIISKQTWGRESHNELFNVMVVAGGNVDIVSNVPSGTAPHVGFLSVIGLFASLPFLFL
ncbi:hypothetical protein QQ020_33300 [Fulvivirgaceae bacterium BMA12]|uniref:Uncharacterized protein n=1 Tax=Agaribacillus aureus TaxID=3051825 RepID=A0ABT8LJU7_9BACT|nr:hypothetical protein [Fulvivirgaceae bacterium BMA12]